MLPEIAPACCGYARRNGSTVPRRTTGEGSGALRERQAAEQRSGRLAKSKSQCEAYVCDFFFLAFFFAITLLPAFDAPRPFKMVVHCK